MLVTVNALTGSLPQRDIPTPTKRRTSFLIRDILGEDNSSSSKRKIEAKHNNNLKNNLRCSDCDYQKRCRVENTYRKYSLELDEEFKDMFHSTGFYTHSHREATPPFSNQESTCIPPNHFDVPHYTGQRLVLSNDCKPPKRTDLGIDNRCRDNSYSSLHLNAQHEGWIHPPTLQSTLPYVDLSYVYNIRPGTIRLPALPLLMFAPETNAMSYSAIRDDTTTKMNRPNSVCHDVKQKRTDGDESAQSDCDSKPPNTPSPVSLSSSCEYVAYHEQSSPKGS
uniref:Transcription factor protein n=2 Tax=Ciona intestinalis TaxID=7719 RepID=F7AVT0_CIOIN